MTKIANTQYPVHDFIKKRWSPRAFSEKPIEREKLQSILEAARWAPSCFNAQPWRFLLATKEHPEAYDRMFGCLMEGNQSWAKSAPVLLISVAQLQFEHNGKSNRHAWHDVGLAVQNLIVQAMTFDIYVHQMAGFDAEKARQTYSIPDGFEPVAAIALGYLGDPNNLPDEMKERELAAGTRNALAEFVFAGSWGNTASVIQD